MSIQKDSSIWENIDSFSAVRKKDMSMRVGMVRELIFRDTGDVRYMVEVFNSNNQLPISCSLIDRFGGAFNYEEYTHRGFTVDKSAATASKYAVRAGDVVLVAYAGGDSREGIIIGGLQHPSRKLKVNKADGIAYNSEFNGLKKTINKDGEYKVLFQGTPTNVADLSKVSDGNNVPAPKYDTDIGGSFYEFDKTGSWKLTDSAKEDPQSIFLDKKGGTLTITSGKVIIKVDKAAEKIDVTAKDVNWTVENSIKAKTKDYSMEAEKTVKIKSAKIAIGTDGTELLDQLVQLVDAIGKLAAVSPVGPCSPLTAAPTWTNVEKIKSSINKIKGSL